MGDALKIIQLSDLHIGLEGASKIFDNIKTRLRELSPDLILITGDIVDTPSKKNADYAFDELKELNNIARTFIVLGNHDRWIKGNAFLRKLFGPSKNVSDKLAEFIINQKNQFDLKNLKIGLVGLDSSNESNFLAQGYISSSQLKKFETEIRDLSKSNCDILITCVHHHPIKIAETENSPIEEAALTFVNSAQFLRTVIRVKPDFIFHGHHHHERLCWYSEEYNYSVPIISAGSAVGASAINCDISKSSFNEILIKSKNNITLITNNWDKVGNQWVCKERIIKSPDLGRTDHAHMVIRTIQQEMNMIDGSYIITNSTYENGSVAASLYKHLNGTVIGTSFYENPIKYGHNDFAKALKQGCKFYRITGEELLTNSDLKTIKKQMKNYKAESKIVCLKNSAGFSKISGIYSKLNDNSYLSFIALNSIDGENNKGLVFCGNLAKEVFDYYYSLIPNVNK